MDSSDFNKQFSNILKLITINLIIIILIPTVIYLKDMDWKLSTADDEILSKSKVDQTTVSTLVENEGFEIVRSNCTSCHSDRLITQNRATREGWLTMIRWMQNTQNLWPLGENETIILNYLTKNYAPEQIGRRKALSNIEWYQLEE